MNDFTPAQIEQVIEICEIAYCTWLYRIDAFDDMESAYNFYNFVLSSYRKLEEYNSLYDFIQEGNLKKLHKEYFTSLNP